MCWKTLLVRLGQSTVQRFQSLFKTSMVITVLILLFSLAPRLGRTSYYVAPAAFFLTSLFHVYLFWEMRTHIKSAIKGKSVEMPYYQPSDLSTTARVETRLRTQQNFAGHLFPLLSSYVLASLWLACFAINVFALIQLRPWEIQQYHNGWRVTMVQGLEMAFEVIEAGVLGVLGLVFWDERKRWRTLGATRLDGGKREGQ